MTGTRLQPIFLKRNVTYYVMHTTTYKTKTFFSENVAAAVAAADRKKKLISFEVFPKNEFCAKQVTFLEVLLLFLTLFERHQHRCSIYWQSDYSQFFRVFLASVNQQMEEATNNWKKNVLRRLQSTIQAIRAHSMLWQCRLQEQKRKQ